MERFMIEQYGFFDEKKQQRDFKDIFWGVEACLMKDEHELRRFAR